MKKIMRKLRLALVVSVGQLCYANIKKVNSDFFENLKKKSESGENFFQQISKVTACNDYEEGYCYFARAKKNYPPAHSEIYCWYYLPTHADMKKFTARQGNSRCSFFRVFTFVLKQFDVDSELIKELNSSCVIL